MTSLTARPGAPALPTPYALVAGAVAPVVATKRELLAMSRAHEVDALRGGATEVQVTFQERRHLTTATRASYGALARAGTRVHAFARGLVSDYRPDSDGLVTVALLAADPLVDEWDLVLRRADGSGTAFVAQDLAPGVAAVGPDLDRRFRWARTDDPDLVRAAGLALLSRLPAPGPGAAV